MADGDIREGGDLAAGAFSTWLTDLQGALRGERASDVPCGGCTACCTSSQFIHIGPDEAETLAHIPAALLFAAPRLPRGHVVLGYDERGHCPMLIDNQCSIYEHRPRTCRTYDCRIFSAVGVGPDDDGKALIAQRAARWRFAYPTEADRIRRDAVRAAAAFLQEHAGRLAEGTPPPNTTRLAVLAIEIHHLFIHHDEHSDRTTVIDPGIEAVRAEVQRRSDARGSTGDGRRPPAL